MACDRSERTLVASASSDVTTAPPSPTQSCFLEKNDRHPMWPAVPAIAPAAPTRARMAWAASSISVKP